MPEILNDLYRGDKPQATPRTLELFHRAIESAPIFSKNISGGFAFIIERYITPIPDLHLPEMPAPVVTFQGTCQSIVHRTAGQYPRRTLPSSTFLIPGGQPSHWQSSYPVDFVLVYFKGEAQKRLVEAVGSTRGPLVLLNPILDAAAATLRDEMNSMTPENDFVQALAIVLHRQLCREAAVAVGAKRTGLGAANSPGLRRVEAYVESNLAQKLTLSGLASIAGMSISHFRERFRVEMGMAPHHYISGKRLEQARRLLAMTRIPLGIIAIELGYASQSHFSTLFKNAYGVTPMTFRRVSRKGFDELSVR
ncbi:MAG: helix-turn-helix transcriptional regulator [Gammaproteobacteria bacterium]|nr:helix-turn-helix transcriptional regulator [Gammaproteobacteria bacterium]